MKYTIDRIEGTTAVLEGYDGSRLEIDAKTLPKGAKEGAAIEINPNGVITIFVDEERAKRIADKMKSVWKN